MNKSILLEFLSEDNLNLHLSHLKNATLKYSILKKSIGTLTGLSAREVLRSGLKRSERDEAFDCLSYIESHRNYFDSFAPLTKKCDAVRKYFGSEDKFLYEIFECARYESHGFVYVCIDSRRRPKIEFAKPHDEYLKNSPILALDLYEHAYFLDYAFEKEKYLRSAISRLDIEKLDKALTLS